LFEEMEFLEEEQEIAIIQKAHSPG